MELCAASNSDSSAALQCRLDAANNEMAIDKAATAFQTTQIKRRRKYDILPHCDRFRIRIDSEVYSHDKWYLQKTYYMGGYDSRRSATLDIARFEYMCARRIKLS